MCGEAECAGRRQEELLRGELEPQGLFSHLME